MTCALYLNAKHYYLVNFYLTNLPGRLGILSPALLQLACYLTFTKAQDGCIKNVLFKSTFQTV